MKTDDLPDDKVDRVSNEQDAEVAEEEEGEAQVCEGSNSNPLT